MSEQEIPWDDLRTILAIARAGSLSGAARELKVSHATVFRRLGHIEERLGVKLFERGRGGYAPSPAGEEIADAATRIEAEVIGVERRVIGRDLRPAGTVRVATTDTLLIGLLSPVFAAFREAYPDIALEVSVSNAVVNLSRREADVAIRPTTAPPEHLIGRRLVTIEQAVYGRAGDFREGDPVPAADATAWVGPDEGMVYRQLDAWMAAHGADAYCRYRADTLFGMYAAVREGVGAAVMPRYLCDADPRLVRLGPAIPEMASELWLLSHPDLRGVGRIRALTGFVAEALGTPG